MFYDVNVDDAERFLQGPAWEMVYEINLLTVATRLDWLVVAGFTVTMVHHCMVRGFL
jgi:hypothetical protein